MERLTGNRILSDETEISNFAKPRLCAGDECPVCQNGEMVEETETIFGQPDTIFRCDGLLDPEDENKPLAACPHTQEIACA